MNYKKAFKMGIFMKDYLDGKITCDDLDLYVEQWHKHNGNENVYDFLGITEQQYMTWLKNPDDLEKELKPLKIKKNKEATAKELIDIAKQIIEKKDI